MFRLPELISAYNYGYVSSPLGLIEVAEQEEQLKQIFFIEQARSPETQNDTLKLAKQQLSEYMTGERQNFDLPLAPEGTDFQKQVWQALLTLKYGETCSYLDIATQIGNLKAVRAVGAANGKNPLSIVVPCHRVIGKSGKLTGYAGGLSKKAWLLDLEMRQNSLL